MKDCINWGILGTGFIAHKFAQGLSALSDATLAAVGSRSVEHAQKFAYEFGAPKAYGNYEELVSDSDIDVIYIASPISMHYEHALLCLNHGKNVLCEKSFTINEVQAMQIVQLAHQKKLFLMEAMWTRFLPVTVKVMEWLNSGAIGEVRMLTAELGFRTDWKPECLLLNPQFGGGALLSMGVYPVSFASMVFNSQPTSISTISYIGQTSVDEQSMALFNYEGGKMASLMSAIRTQTTTNGYIYGTDGYIYMPKFFAPRSAELFVSGSEPVHYEPEFLSTGYNYEAAEVGFCLRNGKTESCVMPLCESVAIMHTMDNIRKQWNFKYPFE